MYVYNISNPLTIYTRPYPHPGARGAGQYSNAGRSGGGSCGIVGRGSAEGSGGGKRGSGGGKRWSGGGNRGSGSGSGHRVRYSRVSRAGRGNSRAGRGDSRVGRGDSRAGRGDSRAGRGNPRALVVARSGRVSVFSDGVEVKILAVDEFSDAYRLAYP